MKNITTLIILILSLMGYESCKTSRLTKPEDLKGNRILLSSGGGVTGSWTTWCLLENGDVLQQDQVQGPFRRIRSIPEEHARSLFLQMDTLIAKTTPFNHPGNMTSLIDYHKNQQSTVYKWGAPDFVVPQGVATCYQEILSVLK